MTVQVSNANSARRLSLSQKLAVASGAAAAFTGVAAPQLAEAGIVRSTTLPLSPPGSDESNFWDVDGDGSNDFELANSNTSMALVTELGASRFVAPMNQNLDGFAKLATGFAVGSNLGTAYKFFVARQAGIKITSSSSIDADVTQGGWAMGDTGYFGFKFTNAGGVHYGWGTMHIIGSPAGSGYTFTEAYYNTTPNASIQVGDTGGSPSSVPEIDPASAGSVLSLVMGSLAMLERRRLRRAKAAEGDATVSA
jgi:hypothetical protein